MTVTFEPIKAADADALANVHARSGDSDPWSAQSYRNTLSQAPALGIRALEQGETIAFALAQRVFDEADILMVACKRERQGQGIARACVAHLMDALKDAGTVQVHLEVSEGKAHAVGLYVALGFQRAGRRPLYYPDGSDALVMQRALCG